MLLKLLLVLKKGLTQSTTGDDSYTIGSYKSEIELIKDQYKSVKKELDLPNYSRLSKSTLLEILKTQGNEDTKNFVSDIIDSRAEMVSEIENNLSPVEWWNYKFQGERLFKNNNSFFLFLPHTDPSQDARQLTATLSHISTKATD